MPSVYEPMWPRKYWIGCLARVKNSGIILTPDHEDTFKEVCDSIQRLSKRVRTEGVMVGTAANPLIQDMRDLEDESLRVFQASGYAVTAGIWPSLSHTYTLIADGVLNA